jgi:hypothetical protein
MNTRKILSVLLLVASSLSHALPYDKYRHFDPTTTETIFEEPFPGVCALEFSSLDSVREIAIGGMIVAAENYKEAKQPAFSSGGLIFWRDENKKSYTRRGPLHFSRWKGGPKFPSVSLFKYMSEESFQDLFGSTNNDSDTYESLINTILDIGSRAWQISVDQGRGSDGEIYDSYYYLSVGTNDGWIEVPLLIDPTEVLKFVDCSYPLIREFRSESLPPGLKPDFTLVCDQEKIDPVLGRNLPITTLEFFNRNKLVRLSKLGQSKTYDLVHFDNTLHDGRLNAEAIQILSPVGGPQSLYDLMDKQYGQYDSYARFNSMLFLPSEDPNYAWNKIELWRDLDYVPEMIKRGCRQK